MIKTEELNTFPKTKGGNKMNNFNVDQFLKDLKEFSNNHQNELNPTSGERDLLELKRAVAKLKEERKAKDEANRLARKTAVDKSNNISVDRYVALV